MSQPNALIARRRLLLGAAAFTALPALRAQQRFPVAGRPVRLVVSFPPGGGADAVGRRIAPLLAERWGVPVVVENKGGANQLIAAQDAAQATPDGHTLLLATEAVLTALPHQLAKLGYEPFKDLRPVAPIFRSGVVLVVHPSLPARNLAELAQYARANSGKLNYASWGGLISVAYPAMLARQWRVEMTNVPYKGIGPMLPDLLENRVQLAVEASPQGMAQIKAGKLRPLAVTGTTRMPALPDVPTFAEQGVQGFEYNGSVGIFANGRVPDDVVGTINQHVSAAGADAGVRQLLEQANYEPFQAPPEQYAQMVRGAYEMWGPIVRDFGLRLD
ncbi:Bug family tripartite tricarboxylate transporter substrate binding protein [Ramlibacter albus]|uniref:Tripartite tricarboxylate transporter substrate binding protein n=1 Tax=Ramlibacter albus TaxID=2079448 RepID=A0A923S6K3_9BURK|nr:tripartite tricarboxylate transporter substrate binding protein [Ramlibacter albus]MBC5766237.1 tripartite tricarboxylate transporter substrate binding protein [Ramlibacter albus]